MNRWIGMGRLTADPDVRYTTGDKPMCVARFTIACDRRFKKQGGNTADFIRCVAFGKTGEFVEKYCHKGTKLAASGAITTGSYTNRDGQKVFTTEVNLDEVEFAESKAVAAQIAQTQAQDTQESTPAQAETVDSYVHVPDTFTDSMPFE